MVANQTLNGLGRTKAKRRTHNHCRSESDFQESFHIISFFKIFLEILDMVKSDFADFFFFGVNLIFIRKIIPTICIYKYICDLQIRFYFSQDYFSY